MHTYMISYRRRKRKIPGKRPTRLIVWLYGAMHIREGSVFSAYTLEIAKCIYCSEGVSLGEVRCRCTENQGEIRYNRITVEYSARHTFPSHVLSRQLDIIRRVRNSSTTNTKLFKGKRNVSNET